MVEMTVVTEIIFLVNGLRKIRKFWFKSGKIDPKKDRLKFKSRLTMRVSDFSGCLWIWVRVFPRFLGLNNLDSKNFGFENSGLYYFRVMVFLYHFYRSLSVPQPQANLIERNRS